MTATPLPVFLFYDAVGALVWAGAALLVGVVFSDFVDVILAAFSAYGHLAVLACLGAFGLFLAWRVWWRFHMLRRTRRVPRMTVDELEARRRAGTLPLVLDVRAHGPVPIERIPGAMVVDMHGSLDALGSEIESRDIVVYCACPHEISAAILAERLRAAGYQKTWALAGGFDEWNACMAPNSRRLRRRRPTMRPPADPRHAARGTQRVPALWNTDRSG